MAIEGNLGLFFIGDLVTNYELYDIKNHLTRHDEPYRNCINFIDKSD